MKTIAFATYDESPSLTDDDRAAAAALEARGARVRAAVWDDPKVAWREFDAVVVRSCWDYHLRPREFLAWVDALEAAGVALWNPPAVVRWNVEKTYLRDLARRGVPVVPTVWLGPGEEPGLAAVLEREGWARAVVKPTVSLSAYETWVTSAERASGDEPAARRMLARGGVMVQPFLEEVVAGGEWSVVFFGGAYSHAVLKRPAAGDFRTQSDFGGSKTVADPPARVLDAARRALDAVDGPLLYARVDGVEVGGRLLLMELELVDPELFFSKVPEAGARFADALLV
jgi:glutathione synthase/RimK-type ligase-like ATP-grasp enzyme